MKRKTATGERNTALWQRVIRLEGELSPSAARALLGLRFSRRDHEYMNRLSAKARAGRLSPSEEVEIDTFRTSGVLVRYPAFKSAAGAKEASLIPAVTSALLTVRINKRKSPSFAS